MPFAPLLDLAARLRLRFPPERPDRRDARAVLAYAMETLVLSRLAIAMVLAVGIGLGGAFLALGHAGLSDAAAVLPEPILPSASPTP